MSGLFDLIVGGEDVERHKPYPDALLHALNVLHLAPYDAVYVGDHPVDAQAAQNAGMSFYATLTGTSTLDQFAPYPVAKFLASLDHAHGEIGARKHP